MSLYQLYVDGGAKPNPGKGYGSYLLLKDGEFVKSRSRIEFGYATNNQAEFLILIYAMLDIEAITERVIVISDSLHVIESMNGKRVMHNQTLALLSQIAKEIALKRNLSFTRAENRDIIVAKLGH